MQLSLGGDCWSVPRLCCQREFSNHCSAQESCRVAAFTSALAHQDCTLVSFCLSVCCCHHGIHLVLPSCLIAGSYFEAGLPGLGFTKVATAHCPRCCWQKIGLLKDVASMLWGVSAGTLPQVRRVRCHGGEPCMSASQLCSCSAAWQPHCGTDRPGVVMHPHRSVYL